MGDSLSILRLFSVLAVFMALVISLFVGQVGAAAAQGAADAAAIAVADLAPADWHCNGWWKPENNNEPSAQAAAASAAVFRTSQLAAVQPAAVEVSTDGTCSIIVSVRVESEGWLGWRSASGIACRRPPFASGAGLHALVAPPC